MSRQPILFVLKKFGTDYQVYHTFLSLCKRKNLQIIKQQIVYLKKRTKFCKEFYPHKYNDYKKEILDSFDHCVLAILIDIGHHHHIHMRIKKYLRQKFGANVVHCSDNTAATHKEYDILMDNGNQALFEKPQHKRSYEYKLLRKYSV